MIAGGALDVFLLGARRRVRLLNVDTPETVRPGSPPSCLGAEATPFLTDRLPVSSGVRLRYDVERQDRFGSDRTGVVHDGALVPPSSGGTGITLLHGPDLDCADIRRKVGITGRDYHGHDNAGDGWGCESHG